jgi:glycine/D-amino acid oxidase-like deaminating enzyme
MDKIHTVGIIGGGVSGVVIALELAKYGIEHILFEQEESVVNGPPFCHLHAGGNLYPDISDEQCRILMQQSIDMARLFPQSIDERPTLISVPKSEKYEVSTIENRLEMLVRHYESIIAQDPENQILGTPEAYYKSYSRADLIALKEQPVVKHPKSADEWMTNSMQVVDHQKLKAPILLVQEFGWNLFRLGAQAQLALTKAEQCVLKTNTTITHIADVHSQKVDHNWEIQTQETTYKVKYLVNSTGFRTGELDKTIQLSANRLIEFKAAYVSKWKPIAGLIPELIFHGERDTPHGMVQLTPYCEDYYQIHGMTKDVTLFENGLIQSKVNTPPPEFNAGIMQKLNRAWEADEIKVRTQNAINLVTEYVPSFDSAIVGGPPLYGAQQIPGDDPSLRVGEVSFPSSSYARSEIIKASSALAVAQQVLLKIQEEGIIPPIDKVISPNVLLESIAKSDIDELAGELAIKRGYPKALSRLVIDRD